MNYRTSVTRFLARTAGARGSRSPAWLSCLAAIFTLVAGVSSAPAQSLTYVGRVRMPETNNAFTGGGLTIRTHPSGYRELLSLDVSGRVYGVRLPSAWDDSIATGYVLYGQPEIPTGDRTWSIGLDHTGDLLVFHAPFYPADGKPERPTITRYTITANALTNKRGPFAIPGVHFHRRQGGAFVLPDDVASRFGGRKTVVGFGGYYNIIAGGSPGTSAYAIDVNTGQGTPLIEFPWEGGGTEGERRRGDYSNAWGTGNPEGPGLFDGYWTTTDTRTGAAWGSNGMWVVGHEAIGRMRYGSEAGESGFHADGFRTFVRFYSRTELERLWSGQIKAQQTRPGYWRLADIPNVPTVLGSTQDPQGRMMINPEARVNGVVVEGDLLLIGGLQQWGGIYNDFPAVYAFRIVGGTPNAPAEICGDRIDNDGDGQVDEGCTAAGPPAKTACTVTDWSTWQAASEWSSCDGDTRTRVVRRTRTIITPASGGESCPPLEETSNETRACSGPSSPEVCNNGIDDDGDGRIDEGCGKASAPGAPRRLSRKVQQSTVSLEWQAPITGGLVAGYVVEAGLEPGTTALKLPVRDTRLRIPNVGRGKYFARVRAVNANGGFGPASNEVAITVGCNGRPRPPRALDAATNGGQVTLSWVDDDGCNDTSYRLDVGAIAGTSNLASAAVNVDSLSALAGPGTYFARVSTVSPFGVTEPSNEVKIAVDPTVCNPPSFEVNLDVSMLGRVVELTWSPSNDADALAADNASRIGYVLEIGSASGSANILQVPMGRTTGIRTPAPPGTYFARVRPVNACGAGQPSNESIIRVH